jgi:hypothetical protein
VVTGRFILQFFVSCPYIVMLPLEVRSKGKKVMRKEWKRGEKYGRNNTEHVKEIYERNDRKYMQGWRVLLRNKRQKMKKDEDKQKKKLSSL